MQHVTSHEIKTITTYLDFEIRNCIPNTFLFKTQKYINIKCVLLKSRLKFNPKINHVYTLSLNKKKPATRT